jgi:signal transduction histidine kinase
LLAFFVLLLALWLPGAGHAALTPLAGAEAVLAPAGGSPRPVHVALPHRWDSDFPGVGGRAIYRFTLPPGPPGVPQGLLLPRVGNQAVVRVDGKVAAEYGELGKPGYDATRVPHWILLPSTGTALAIEVEVTTEAARWGGLGRLEHGPAAEVQQAWRSRYEWRAYLPIAVASGLALMTVLTLAIWWLQREPVQLQFAVGALLGVPPYLDRVWAEPPLPWSWWGPAMAVLTFLHGVLFLRAMLAMTGFARPWLDRAVLAYGGAGALLATLAFAAGWPALWTAVLLSTFPVTVWGGWIATSRAWQRRDRGSLVTAAAVNVCWVTVVVDTVNMRLVNDGPASWSVLPLGTLAVLGLMGWLLISRFAAQNHAYRGLLQSLDEKVALRERELRDSHAQLQEEHAEKARLLERQRLMRDIHDGVGAQLVGLLGMIERGGYSRDALKEHADTALSELRMAVDALQPVHGDLTTVLATMRYRLQPRLEAAGLEVAWRVEALPPLAGLTPQVVLHVQRILFETFTNVLRHAKAGRIRVAAREEQDALVIEVEDDGVGLPPDAANAIGHGLRNMRARAEAIGARLVLQPAQPRGTLLTLRIAGQR